MKILFLGGDKRYRCMMKSLVKEHFVSFLGFNISDEGMQEETLETLDLSKYDVILFPISGITDNMEIKTENGNLKLPDELFENLNPKTLFFTGLKTSKLESLVRKFKTY